MRKSTLPLLVLILVLSACGGGRESPEGPGRARAPASPPKPALCPLTGKPVPSGVDIDRPALSVKIDNSPPARPQSGVQEADIVYEQLAEGGITRFNAIYHCADAAQLGPVRSARSVDPDILLEYAPVLLAYAGAAPAVQDKVAATEGITDLRHGSHGSAYRRDRSRRAPLNLYTSTEQLRSLPDAEDVSGAPETGLKFDTSAASPSPTATAPRTAPSPAAASPPATASGAEVSFSFGGRTPSRYTYDAASGSYLRFHGTEAHRTAGGEQISAANVVVFKVEVRPGTIRDAAGNLSPEISVIGSGEAVILTGGRSVTGRWNRSSLSAKTTLTDSGGAPVKLKPGNTWIHLVPATQAVTVK